jgi:hypothetical protein
MGSLLLGRPKVAVANALEAIEEVGDGPLSRENPPSSASEGAQDGVTRRMVQEHDDQDVRTCATGSLRKVEFIWGPLIDFTADDDHIDTLDIQASKEIGSLYCRSPNICFVANRGR